MANKVLEARVLGKYSQTEASATQRMATIAGKTTDGPWEFALNTNVTLDECSMSEGQIISAVIGDDIRYDSKGQHHNMGETVLGIWCQAICAACKHNPYAAKDSRACDAARLP